MFHCFEYYIYLRNIVATILILSLQCYMYNVAQSILCIVDNQPKYCYFWSYIVILTF
jgi:hypothetical protein